MPTDRLSWWRPALVEPEPNPGTVEVVHVWCAQTLWDEGVYPCLRPAHPPGTQHWYDMRAASQPAVEESA